MNKHDQLFVDGVRKYEQAIRTKQIKDLCNARDVAQMRQDIRNLLDLIDRMEQPADWAERQEYADRMNADTKSDNEPEPIVAPTEG